VKVLLTGSSGSIGTALTVRLPAYGHRLRLVDRVPPREGIDTGDAEVVVGDLADRATLDSAMAGVDAVVHLAAIPHEAALADILTTHAQLTGDVLASAQSHLVGRIVLASSNHAVGLTPRVDSLPADAPPRPDGFYGVGKVATEALGRLYSDRFGMAVACLRIGSFLDRPETLRNLSTWLSPDDCTRLVHACLTAPGLTFATPWGISANTRGWWDHAVGRWLGYWPQDDAETYASEVEAADPRPFDLADPNHGYVGGPYAAPWEHPPGEEPA